MPNIFKVHFAQILTISVELPAVKMRSKAKLRKYIWNF